ncbi:MAG: cytochrome P450 [Planctomycetota bacterium]
MPSKRPPGPPNGLMGISHLRDMKRDLLQFTIRRFREHGDAVSWRCGPIWFYQFTHPDQVEEILVKKARKLQKPTRMKQVFAKWEGNGLVVSDGDYWIRQRRLVQPAFQPSRLPRYAEAVEEFTDAMTHGWGEKREILAMQAMHDLTLRIVAKNLFGTDLAEDAGRIRDAVHQIQILAMRDLGAAIPLPDWWPVEWKRKGLSAIADLKALVDRLIAEGRRSGRDQGDLLSMLLSAVDPEGNGQGMTDEQARDEAVTLLIAGHETTTNALVFTLYLLARHPEIQESIVAETRQALGEGTANFANIARLAPVERCFKEALRLYPSVYFTSREVAEPVEIGGYRLGKMSQIHLCPYLMHRDPRWFENPAEFDPSRFLPEREAAIRPFVYLPFGAGPRACIGKGFAMMEAVLILSRILLDYQVSLPPGEREPELEAQISLHPKEDIRLAMTRRALVPQRT